MEVLVLTDEELCEVVGGTFTPNSFSSYGYHQFGISTSYNIFSKDEFMFMGHPISYERANEIMRIGNSVMSSINSGYDHKNKIKSNEAAFIRAFNSQLYLCFGSDYIWDGVPGTTF